ncbi:MAG TPA: monovalent cation/H(+) antiporter subunit G [Coriobacteriia bacterium]|nr:monovalent cation/H(+) antiporter subunit G [Coriobacteriia bacterium]
MNAIEIASAVLLSIGAVFFIAGSVGLLRFPDVYTRLHALTKADNLGLGFVVIGLSVRADSWMLVAKLVLVWALVVIASATTCHLIAGSARTSGVSPWRRRP